MSQLIWAIVHLITGKRRLTLRPHRLRIDSLGGGEYGAGRGSRVHRGFDVEIRPGEVVRAPYTMRIGKDPIRVYADENKKEWQGVRGFFKIGQDNVEVKYFYITPFTEVLDTVVSMGTPIGIAQDISEEYGEAMVPHVHIEHWIGNSHYDATKNYI